MMSPGFRVMNPGNVADHLPCAEDKVVRVRGLARLAVDAALDLKIVGINLSAVTMYGPMARTDPESSPPSIARRFRVAGRAR